MIAKALALNGAIKVYIIGRRKENLETAAKETPYNNIVPIQGDVTSKESLSSIVAQIKEEIGYINVLIANSGIGGPQEGSSATRPDLPLEEFQSKLWSTSFEDYTQTFAVNASSVFFSIVAFLGLLHAGNERANVVQKSQVIVTSSIGGYNKNVPGGYAYGQSKAAATHLVKQMATNLVPYEIRANALAPGRTAAFPACPYVFPHIIPCLQFRSSSYAQWRWLTSYQSIHRTCQPELPKVQLLFPTIRYQLAELDLKTIWLAVSCI